eukprot:6068921-Pyramimonas_sp.AAC.1
MWHVLSCRKEHNTKERGTCRSHIHFGPTLRCRGVQNGWGPDSEIVIFVHWLQALKGGIDFCWSDNG